MGLWEVTCLGPRVLPTPTKKKGEMGVYISKRKKKKKKVKLGYILISMYILFLNRVVHIVNLTSNQINATSRVDMFMH